MPTEESVRPSDSVADGTREALLREHLGLVHRVARDLRRSLAAEADYQEMVSSGTLGLIDAVEHFDPNRGVVFSTFAVPRIRGAILDELRRQDHVPRSVRRKLRLIGQARDTLMRMLGRPATEREVAEHLGIGVEEFWSWRENIEARVHLSLDGTPADGDDHGETVVPAVEEHSEAEARLQREQVGSLIRQAIEALKEQERRVLTLYYFESLKLHQIASLLGLTESRISQIHTAALTKLRGSLSHLRGELA